MTQHSYVFSLIKQELGRQRRGIELIASENFTSLHVMQAAGSVLTNKYAEGYPGRRYYGGCEIVDQIEQIAIDNIKKIFECEYANVQPHSGAQANGALMSAILKPNDTILGLDLSMGGHLTHGSPVNFSGKLYNAISYTVNKEDGRINYKQLEQIALEKKPKLIICGASAYSRDWDYAFIRKVADQIGAFLMCDMAHPAGLIAKGLLNSPLPHCHFVTSTTHKTLRGPRGGIILMYKDFPNPLGIKDFKGEIRMMSQLIDLAVFPGHQGGPLEHIIAAKAIAFEEVIGNDFGIYAQQVIANTKAMETALKNRNYNIVSGGSDNHLLLIDLRNKNISGKQAENLLGEADITINKNMVPYDDKSAFVTSGIRIGTPAITTRGLKEKHMDTIIDYIDIVLNNSNNSNIIKDIKTKVNTMMAEFSLYPELN